MKRRRKNKSVSTKKTLFSVVAKKDEWTREGRGKPRSLSLSLRIRVTLFFSLLPSHGSYPERENRVRPSVPSRPPN